MSKEKVEYYTPSVDELCDGVLFQEKEGTKWIDKQYVSNYTPDTPASLRIAKLNTNDILELGFDKLADIMKGVIFVKRNPSINNNSATQLRLHYVSSMPYVTVSTNEAVLINNMLVKNKYELKWLLKRLNVIV